MIKFIKQFIFKLLLILRKSFLKDILLKLLVGIHNSSYHWISFFSSRENAHPKHKILNYQQFFLDNIFSGDCVLDVGSGNGIVAVSISSKAKKVTGIDILRENIILSNKINYRDNVEFIEGDATTFNFKETFDVIILSNVLEHIKDRISFLKNIKSLAPKILIRVPLVTRDWISVWKKDSGFNYKLDETHHIEYAEENFRKEMEEAGLKVDSYYVKFGELYAITSNS